MSTVGGMLFGGGWFHTVTGNVFRVLGVSVGFYVAGVFGSGYCLGGDMGVCVGPSREHLGGVVALLKYIWLVSVMCLCGLGVGGGGMFL